MTKINKSELGKKRSVSFSNEIDAWFASTAKANNCTVSKVVQSLALDAMEYERQMAQAPDVDEPPPEMEEVVLPE
jgi:hypothetical protein